MKVILGSIKLKKFKMSVQKKLKHKRVELLRKLVNVCCKNLTILLLRRRLSGGGGNHRARKTVKPLIHTRAGTLE